MTPEEATEARTQAGPPKRGGNRHKGKASLRKGRTTDKEEWLATGGEKPLDLALLWTESQDAMGLEANSGSSDGIISKFEHNMFELW